MKNGHSNGSPPTSLTTLLSACTSCVPGLRCELHKRPRVATALCPGCGNAEIECKRSCPRYKPELDERIPLAPVPTAAPSPAVTDKSKSGRTFLDAKPMLARVQRWQAIEYAALRWAQILDAAESGKTSATQLRQAAEELRRVIKETP